MKIFLYLLGIMLIGTLLFLEKILQLLRRQKTATQVPDIAMAFKHQQARSEFARRVAPVKKLSRETPRPGQIYSTRNFTPTEQRMEQTGERTAVSQVLLKKPETPALQPVETAVLQIENILTPHLVEQGQKNVAFLLTIKNLQEAVQEIVSLQLLFQKDKRDVSLNFVVQPNAGNPTQIEPGAAKELGLTVHINKDIPVGEVMITPVVTIRRDGLPERAAVAGKAGLWRIEPVGRTLQITTLHSSETAGTAFSLKLTAYLNNQPDSSYTGKRRVYFSQASGSVNSSVQIPELLDLVFENGTATTAAAFCLYNTADTYVISARDNEPGGVQGNISLNLNPAALGGFSLSIASPQTNKITFSGECQIVALDIFNNIKKDFTGDVEISCASGGKITGLGPAGHILSGSHFSQGIAAIPSMILTLENLPQDGAIVKFVANADGKTGYSEEVTILPGPMSPSASQELIRKLLGSRKPKIWLVNIEADMARILEDHFHRDYDIRAVTIKPAEVVEKFASRDATPPDFVFLDVGEPSRDGYQVLWEIRKIGALESLPILFFGSATASENEISEVLRSGSGYITKPSSLGKLPISSIRAMVSDLLQKASLGRGHLPSQGTRLPGTEGTVYQIIAKIGEGGMGYIYEAKRLRDQSRVVIKYLPPRDLKNITSVVRFVQEAHTVLSFHHENLVVGYDLFMDRNRCFYVMEYIEGQTLEHLLRSSGRLEAARATRITLQVARALQALEEEHRLVHRDIKPANVLVTPEGLVKLVDFGIAKLSNHNLTTMGIILGTPYYLSPEQILGESVTIQSDIYSLGATLYHILTGEVPFQGPDVYSIIHQRLNKTPRDPRQLNPAIPRALAEIIMKMMQRKANRRYDTAKLLVRDLQNLLDSLDSGVLAMEESEPLMSDNQGRAG